MGGVVLLSFSLCLPSANGKGSQKNSQNKRKAGAWGIGDVTWRGNVQGIGERGLLGGVGLQDSIYTDVYSLSPGCCVLWLMCSGRGGELGVGCVRRRVKPCGHYFRAA
ncbi:hypothetical protein B0T11DRAFT_83402 [Plectosphaerella cucumerina]|uniref:Secreted protein n=1 Tax=Plectosphaerella cucumerina TaxID=40658 RepID=A0A8K0X3M8_9PEZI|nr:hypothetical protein B0T11DRAFT_83402 [Plectosphaerella cucumerina]